MSPKRCGRTRLAVIGANAIGLELGQAFGKLGSEVTFLDVAEQIASFEEPEIAAALAEVLTGDGARVLAPANVSRVTQAPDGTVMLEGDLGDAGTRLPVDRVLVATGRAPNTDLALDSAGVKVDVRGFVVVDEQLRSRPRRPRRGGWWCAAVADADTDQLLGVHMAGENAGEVIQAGVYALMAGLTVSEIAAAFHPYLTMAEGLKLAAQTFQRDITHLSCCAA